MSLFFFLLDEILQKPEMLFSQNIVWPELLIFEEFYEIKILDTGTARRRGVTILALNRGSVPAL